MEHLGIRLLTSYRKSSRSGTPSISFSTCFIHDFSFKNLKNALQMYFRVFLFIEPLGILGLNDDETTEESVDYQVFEAIQAKAKIEF
ncbi:CLUMA_CG018376, isoform A [Clunio marinus]|uniref:CLUMA_CG018376, isoform A n=1 Tax=Clunio marinus TaxID=568069 RepID=A0A1J1IZG1_9DIPT|nr:CLUMA_CG018376, isoform A [Clunio marinus]